MKKSRLLVLCAAGALASAVCLGASRLVAPADRGLPPGETVLREIVLESIGDLLTVRREHPLTEAQRNQIAATFAAHRDDIVLQAHARLEAQRALHAAIFDGAGDAAVRAAAQRVGTAMVDGALLRSRITADVKPILTHGQVTAWRSFCERVDRRVDAFFAKQL